MCLVNPNSYGGATLATPEALRSGETRQKEQPNPTARGWEISRVNFEQEK